jgi:hypothetical protein
VHQAVEVPSGLLNRLAHVIFAVEIEDVGDEVEGVLVVVDFGVEAGEVEAVGQVLFVDLAEVLVAAGGYELQRDQLSVRLIFGESRNQDTVSVQIGVGCRLSDSSESA